MAIFVAGLDLPADDKQRLLALTPASYIGLAAELARRSLDPEPPTPPQA
jgi:adenylosuccinate lyase